MGKKSYQKRKIICNKITDGLILGGLFLVGILFLISSTLNMLVCKNLNSNNLLCYRGNCVITKRNFARNTTYVFTLGNGDVVSVPSEHLRSHDMLLENTNLSFEYVGPKTINGYGVMGAYTGVSISTLDDSFSFLNAQAVKEDIEIGVFVYLVISAAGLIVSLWSLKCLVIKE